MISDRITLNLAYVYLKRIQSNEGTVSDILITVKNPDNPVKKALKRFNSISELKSFTDIEAPPMSVEGETLSCMRMSLYELKSFNIKKIIGEKIGIIPIKNEISIRKFKTRGEITRVSMSDINEGYYPNYLEVDKQLKGLNANEYIKKQNTYIDCGYIDGDLAVDISALKDMYKKYKIV